MDSWGRKCLISSEIVHHEVAETIQISEGVESPLDAWMVIRSDFEKFGKVVSTLVGYSAAKPFVDRVERIEV